MRLKQKLTLFLLVVTMITIAFTNIVNAVEVVEKPDDIGSETTDSIKDKLENVVVLESTLEGLTVNDSSRPHSFSTEKEPGDGKVCRDGNWFEPIDVDDNNVPIYEEGSTLSGKFDGRPVNSKGENIYSYELSIRRVKIPTVEDMNMQAEFEIYDSYNTDGMAAWYLTEYESYVVKVTCDKYGNYVIDTSELPAGRYIINGSNVNGEMVYTENRFAYEFFYIGKDGEVPPDNDESKELNINYEYERISNSPTCSSSISSEIYDVTKAIPTNEYLNYSLTATASKYEILVRKTTAKSGVEDIKYKYTAYYETTNKSGDTIKKRISGKEKKYSYSIERVLYDVPVSKVYPAVNGSVAIMNNAINPSVLSSGGITLNGLTGPGAQAITLSVDEPKIKLTNGVYVVHLGTFSSKTEAEKEIKNSIKAEKNIRAAVNDSISWTGIDYEYNGLEVVTNGTSSYKSGTPTIGNVSGVAKDKLIPAEYPNGEYTGDCSVTYSDGTKIRGGVNNVKIHTPVVNDAKISNVSKFINQKIIISPEKTYIMLDEQFTITIPDDGTHIDEKCYGTRKYNSGQGVGKGITTWGKIKDVKLPFDAYLHYKKNGYEYKYFVKADTWLSESGASDVISLTGNSYTFTVPVWVTEKVYDIETRVIALNTSNNEQLSSTEIGKNLSPDNYVAIKTIPVEVIGKIYDLRISSCNDPGWNSIYSWKTKKTYIAAEEFPFGAQGQNRVQQYKYAPKLGYTFVFDFKTKGRKSNNIDVSVQPEGFYFVSKSGGTAIPVDLYYNTTAKNNVKINLTDNNVSLAVTLREAMYKVPAIEFTDSVRIYNSKYNYANRVNIGNFAKLNLPENLRLCYNNFAEYVNSLYGRGKTQRQIGLDAGSEDNVIGSVGHWYAGYRLPASTKAISAGSDINLATKNNSYLKDGYILVKFEIKTKYQNLNGNYEYLKYMGPEALNEKGDNTGTLIVDWTKTENQTIKLPNGNTAQVPVGSVAIFDSDLRSTNDAEVAGTH